MSQNTERQTSAPVAEADTEGHMIAQYDDGQGYKGPPKPVTGGAGLDPVGAGGSLWRKWRDLGGWLGNLPY
jgi:hypothetical protein